MKNNKIIMTNLYYFCIVAKCDRRTIQINFGDKSAIIEMMIRFCANKIKKTSFNHEKMIKFIMFIGSTWMNNIFFLNSDDAIKTH